MEILGIVAAGVGLKKLRDYIQDNKGDVDDLPVSNIDSSIDMTPPLPLQVPVNQYPYTQELQPQVAVQGFGAPDLSYQLPMRKSGGMPPTHSTYATVDTDPQNIQWSNPSAYMNGHQVSSDNNDYSFDANSVEGFNASNFQQMNPTAYEDGILPVAYGSFDGNVLRQDALEPHLFMPRKTEVSQAMMRAPPQVQTNVHGNAPTHIEDHDRILEQTKFLSGKGALNHYRPDSGSGFASGELITQRVPNTTRIFPIIPAKQGVQITGRMGNPSNAAGKVGSEYSTGRGPLGELREARNAFVSEYERVPFPTPTQQTSQAARVGQVILKETQRQTTEIAWMGPAGNGEKNQAALRVEQPFVKPKNLISTEIVGTVGVAEFGRGGYQNVEINLKDNNRDSTGNVGTEHIQQPGTRAGERGSYQSVEVELKMRNINLTELKSTEHVQQPGTRANERGAYTGLEFDLKNQNRDTTGTVGTEHVQQPGTRSNERGVYTNLEVILPTTLRQLTSAEKVGAVGTTANDRGAYQNIQYDLDATNRETTSLEQPGAPGQSNGLGTYSNIDVDLTATNRTTMSTAELVGAPHNAQKGAAAAYNSSYNERTNNRSTPGYEDGRPAGPSIAHNSVADWRMEQRINNHDQPYTLKDVDTFNERVPVGNRTGAMQYNQNYPVPETRRVSPLQVRTINPEMLNALRSNPYTQPITNDAPPRPF
uniref:Uncharacterized protein n=1 Tax=Clandestinovirus TaxID=2831644 RepID=A0A8F8PKI4_9VIRU|nr:hypothetical protein KOM_12_533 [Clandestinovirus]